MALLFSATQKANVQFASFASAILCEIAIQIVGFIYILPNVSNAWMYGYSLQIQFLIYIRGVFQSSILSEEFS